MDQREALIHCLEDDGCETFPAIHCESSHAIDVGELIAFHRIWFYDDTVHESAACFRAIFSMNVPVPIPATAIVKKVGAVVIDRLKS